MNTRERRLPAPSHNHAAEREIIRAGWRAIDKFLREGRDEITINRLPPKTQAHIID